MLNHNKITGTKYVVFRVDRTYKSIESIGGFQGHMQRTFYTPNANPYLKKRNRILIGSKNIKEDVEKYIDGIKLRKNGNIARDIIMTASPEFFRERTRDDIDNWVELNLKFLKDKFGDNCIYAVLHQDETTPHIHALVVPKFWVEKQQQYKLRSNIYFDGKDKLSKWQDEYAEYINKEFNELKRGIKGSKATHIKIKQYYTLVNADLNDKDFNSILALAKNSKLLEKNIQALRDTLELYKDKYVHKHKELNIEKNKLDNIKNNLLELKEDKEVYRKTIKALSERYHISQQSIKNIVKEMTSDIKNERER